MVFELRCALIDDVLGRLSCVAGTLSLETDELDA